MKMIINESIEMYLKYLHNLKKKWRKCRQSYINFEYMYMSIVLKNSNYYDILSIFHWRIETLYLWLRYSSFNTVPKQCLHLCKVLRLTHFSSKRSNNILIQLNMSTATWHTYLLICTREYDSYVKCSSCHDIESIAINSNVDS